MLEKGQKILALDFGDKRVGLAIAEFGSIAVPLEVIENKGKNLLIEEIRKFVISEHIEVIVVGLPHSFSGETNERLEKTEKFISFLKEKIDLEVYTADEQLTSKLYTKMGISKDIDKHSATAILDTFLLQNNGQ